jgi:hypothetical protein
LFCRSCLRLVFLLSLLIALNLPALAQPQVFAVLPAQDVDGRAIPNLDSRPVVVLVADRDHADTACEMGQKLAFELRGRREVVMLSVIDVSEIPPFLHEWATGQIRQKIRETENSLKERFQASGIAYSPPTGLVVPDWSGRLVEALLESSNREEYALLSKSAREVPFTQRRTLEREQRRLRSRAHLLIFDPDRRTVRHFVDPAELTLAQNHLSQMLQKPVANGQ